MADLPPFPHTWDVIPDFGANVQWTDDIFTQLYQIIQHIFNSTHSISLTTDDSHHDDSITANKEQHHSQFIGYLKYIMGYADCDQSPPAQLGIISLPERFLKAQQLDTILDVPVELFQSGPSSTFFKETGPYLALRTQLAILCGFAISTRNIELLTWVLNPYCDPMVTWDQRLENAQIVMNSFQEKLTEKCFLANLFAIIRNPSYLGWFSSLILFKMVILFSHPYHTALKNHLDEMALISASPEYQQIDQPPPAQAPKKSQLEQPPQEEEEEGSERSERSGEGVQTADSSPSRVPFEIQQKSIFYAIIKSGSNFLQENDGNRDGDDNHKIFMMPVLKIMKDCKISFNFPEHIKPFTSTHFFLQQIAINSCLLDDVKFFTSMLDLTQCWDDMEHACSDFSIPGSIKRIFLYTLFGNQSANLFNFLFNEKKPILSIKINDGRCPPLWGTFITSTPDLYRDIPIGPLGPNDMAKSLLSMVMEGCYYDGGYQEQQSRAFSSLLVRTTNGQRDPGPNDRFSFHAAFDYGHGSLEALYNHHKDIAKHTSLGPLFSQTLCQSQPGSRYNQPSTLSQTQLTNQLKFLLSLPPKVSNINPIQMIEIEPLVDVGKPFCVFQHYFLTPPELKRRLLGYASTSYRPQALASRKSPCDETQITLPFLFSLAARLSGDINEVRPLELVLRKEYRNHAKNCRFNINTVVDISYKNDLRNIVNDQLSSRGRSTRSKAKHIVPLRKNISLISFIVLADQFSQPGHNSLLLSSLISFTHPIQVVIEAYVQALLDGIEQKLYPSNKGEIILDYSKLFETGPYYDPILDNDEE